MSNAAETYNCDRDTNPHLSLHLSSFSGGLLKNFIAGTKFPPKFADTLTSEEEEGIELSLGLSLNGRFGFDPTRDHKNLARSSSIPDFLKPSSTDEGTSVSVTWTPILRTSSLPMEEGCRKRKQMQSLRRIEAKRKRTEKQRNMMMNKKVAIEEDHHTKIMGNTQNDNLLFPNSQGSASSGISDFDTQDNEYTEEGSPQLDKPKPKPKLKPNQSLNGVATDDKSSMRKVLLEMPCVSTTGEGPNGRRIEGFLYRYRKGEEVKIVCVCHGSFLSPAEFVKHAGGVAVLHPLKHIVVTPSPFA